MKFGRNIWEESSLVKMNVIRFLGGDIEGQVDSVSRDEEVQLLRDLKIGIALGPIYVSLELIAAIGEGGICSILF